MLLHNLLTSRLQNFTMNYWHELGADKSKLVMGMPMYGQTFTIGSSDEHGIGAPAPRGGGKKGRFTRQKGFASYYEVRYFLQHSVKVYVGIKLKFLENEYAIMNNFISLILLDMQLCQARWL